jgi:hypothetical protein
LLDVVGAALSNTWRGDSGQALDEGHARNFENTSAPGQASRCRED